MKKNTFKTDEKKAFKASFSKTVPDMFFMYIKNTFRQKNTYLYFNTKKEVCKVKKQEKNKYVKS